MGESIHLGRIAGIRIGANWSLLIIFGLIAWELAGAELPAVAGGYGTTAYWTAAIAVALIFYASLLAHEMAHAIVARRAGIAVDGIVLWLLGGVSKLHGEASDARTELRIAVVGPATSLGLGIGFLAVAAALDGLAAPGLLVGSVFWLGLINGVLGVFNLLPAFPLDGGRVLRAYVWRRRGEKLAATEAAAKVGKGFGWGLVGLGVLELAGGGAVGGVWFMLLGWFVISASQAEAFSSLLTSELDGVPVGAVMTPAAEPLWIALNRMAGDELVCGPDEAVIEVLRRMSERRARRALVIDPIVGTGDAAMGRLLGTVVFADVSREMDHRALVRRLGADATPPASPTALPVPPPPHDTEHRPAA
jgi:Zn-dependent protease